MCLVKEPLIFQELESKVGELVNQFITPNVVKYVILNKDAYQGLVNYYMETYGIERYPDTILDYPIVLDTNSRARIKVVSNCYTEFKLRNL